MYMYRARRDAEHGYIDLSGFKAAIGQIKGIGENRLNEIMDVIQNFVDNAEKNKALDIRN